MADHKTIVKNSLFLYFRMFITMGVGLYTSRLILEALGVVDYGIYGLVGGIVTMFGFLNSSMAASTQRYLAFDIGKGDSKRLQETFTASLNIHFLIGILIVILAETIGLWFVNHKLDIPADRMYAANWVYQFSILSFFFKVIQVPYNALMIAREQMSIYAYMSILDVGLKLLIVIYVLNTDTDRLILYAFLIFCLSFLVRMLYQVYCRKKFKESKYKFYYNKAYYKELLSYSGWNLFGNIAAMARTQGSNILLNLFFGPVANAAYSLTTMVQGSIGSFVSNFQVAINPQITKNYAKKRKNESINLMYKSSKYSFFVMLILILPILYNLEFFLRLWLKNIPPLLTNFIEIALIFSLIETISNPLMTGIQATGKIKKYQAIVGTIVLLNFPLVWAVLKVTEIPENVYWVFCGVSLLSLVFRLYFLQATMEVKINGFFQKVIYPIFTVSIFTSILFILSKKILPVAENILDLGLETISIILISGILIIFTGMNSTERGFFKQTILAKTNKWFR